jgi:hypothetical protein
MNEVFGMKTSFMAYLLLVYYKCRLVVKIFFVVIALKFLIKYLQWSTLYYSISACGPAEIRWKPFSAMRAKRE